MNNLWAHALSILIALGSLGWTVGWFVGLSGSDSAVLAAVLPAVLSISGGILVFRFATQKENADHRQGTIINLSIILFTAFLFVGSLCGRYSKEEADNYNLHQYFETCSNEELRVNANRKLLGLSPLKSEVFCK